jgi:hypothetical protein
MATEVLGDKRRKNGLRRTLEVIGDKRTNLGEVRCYVWSS